MVYVMLVKIKNKRAPFSKVKKCSQYYKSLQFLHMNLFCLINIMSIAKKYCFVIFDDFLSFTWTYFLHVEGEASEIIFNHIKIVKNYRSKSDIDKD